MSQRTPPSSRYKVWFESILRSPFKLRAVVGATLLGTWYFVLYQPIVAQISTMTQRLNTDRKRLELATTIEDLQLLTRRFQEKVTQSSDQNEVVQYLMGGIRQRPIKLVSLVPMSTSELGDYRLVQVSISVEGSYTNMEALMRWIEADPHLFRIEQFQFGLARTQSTSKPDGLYSLNLTVVGIFG
ncbi:hypothetical protein SAMN05444166_2593 [Singulisphaera sp. GP187]|uniref:hypothetical protein n=1 Tax=Singulisphaera sp. GP187 TaxID=1882752 RepID=UPI000927ED11|nr:hypothetical protein [Singulisphaera sp. GP187]SIO12658.1 hypothetical protein SAMN05444166_2593 [Singulisphaera sp. GP187]